MTKIIWVPEDKLYERITVIESLYGNYDKATLVDNNISYYFQFPVLKQEIYIEKVPKSDGMMEKNIKGTFQSLQWLTLINLRSFPDFGTYFVAV